jgi:hypothetical protein
MLYSAAGENKRNMGTWQLLDCWALTGRRMAQRLNSYSILGAAYAAFAYADLESIRSVSRRRPRARS